MKICVECNQSKSLNEFYLRRPGKWASKCKDCCNKDSRERWKKNGASIKKRRNLRKKQLRSEFKSVPSLATRICSTCKINKPKSEYTASGWISYRCRICVANNNKKYWADNAEELKKQQKIRYPKIKDKIVAINRDRRVHLRAEVAKLKGNPCTDCGEKYPPHVMEFDHLDEKIYGIAVMVRRGWTVEKIKKELKKCELVCACCHRDRSKKRMEPARAYRSYEIRKRDFIDSCKDIPCADCGNKLPPHQMDLDHINGEKISLPSRLFQRSWDVIKAEIAKCEVVCANCHKIRTYEREQYNDLVFR